MSSPPILDREEDEESLLFPYQEHYEDQSTVLVDENTISPWPVPRPTSLVVTRSWISRGILTPVSFIDTATQSSPSRLVSRIISMM